MRAVKSEKFRQLRAGEKKRDAAFESGHDTFGYEMHEHSSSGDPCDESDAGRNVLGSVGDVLANIGFGEAEFIGQQESLAILLERKPPILVDGMDRHRKEPELHGLLFSKQAFVWHRTCVVRRMKTSSKSK